MKISEATKAKSVDPASQEILQLAADQEIETVWDRLEKQQPQCGFGELGLCCRICMMGPCRIDPFGEGAQKGACGATADTIVARHLVRMIAAGAAAHSDHGRRPALLLKEIAEGRNHEYQITDPEKLKAIAARLGLDHKDCDIKELARKVADIALNDFGKQDEETLAFVKAYAPKKRLERWHKIAESLSSMSEKTIGILPRGIDREIVDIMHRTHFGVDHGPLSLIAQGVRAAIGDGWGGSLIATEIQDVIFGTPKIIIMNTRSLTPKNLKPSPQDWAFPLKVATLINSRGKLQILRSMISVNRMKRAWLLSKLTPRKNASNAGRRSLKV